ncbi:MAG: HAMP domain-containing sensor histidine kinase [Gemmatimonadaceae bacterium]
MQSALHPRRGVERMLLAWLGGSMIFVLALLATLTAQTLRAARRHRAIAESMEREWVYFARETFRKRIEANLFMAMSGALTGVRANAGSAPALDAILHAADSVAACRCSPAFRPRYAFSFEANTRRRLTSAGIPGDTVSGAVMLRALALARGHAMSPLDMHLLADTIAGRMHMLVFRTIRGEHGAIEQVTGIEADSASFITTAITESFDEGRLLPKGVMPDTATPAVVSAAVTTPSGLHLFTHGGTGSGTLTSAMTIAPFMGALTVSVALDPELVHGLLVGGPPDSPVRLLLVLDLLAVALLAAMTWFAWRAAVLSRARAAFVASVSHDLRTPLSQVMIAAETMALGRLRTVGECQREAAVILEESRRLLGLIENVLDFSSADRAQAPGAIRTAPLGVTVQEVVKGLEPTASALGMSITLAVENDVALPMDAIAMRRALANVIENSLKYTRRRNASVAVGVTANASVAEVAVDDDGPGIPAGERDRVFLPYVRLARDVEREISGSGIGLTITRDIVARHGGTVRVEGNARGGARIVMAFPLAAKAG